jgi:hypothetical protein
MPKFYVKIEDTIITAREAVVEVEAEDREAAIVKAQVQADEGELDFEEEVVSGTPYEYTFVDKDGYEIDEEEIGV